MQPQHQQHHIVWGKVEAKDSCGASSEHSAPFAKNARVRPEMSGYLEGVYFTNESSGSAAGSRTSSFPASRASSASSQQAGPPPSPAVHAALTTLSASAGRPVGGSRGSSGKASGSASRREGSGGFARGASYGGDSESAGQDADDFDAGSVDGVGGGVAAVVVNMEEGAQRKLVSELLEDGGPEIPGLAEFWSAGTSAHGTSACRPCHYVHTTSGCLNGLNCEFCHLPHAKKTRPRPCKSRRVQTRRFGLVLEEVHAQQSDRFFGALNVVAAESAQVRELVESGAFAVGNGPPAPRPTPSSLGSPVSGSASRPGGQKKHILSL
mmetsp:Transcript_38700/g.111239  ORF Transcript_38700/g.111239 Transcript_38700/m.111239 type:complete len:323 (-) Transcript_38700:211-1179(-)